VRALVDAMVGAHAADRERYELLATEMPHRSAGARRSEGHLRGALRLALAARADELPRRGELERTVFVVGHMLDALVHGAVVGRPRRLSLAAAKEETVRAICAYLRS